MENINLFVDKLSPFWQGIVGSAVFDSLALLLRLFLRLGSRLASHFGVKIQHDILFKHWTYKDYVKSSELVLFSYGHFYVIMHVLRWATKSGLFLVFFFGVASMMEKNWLHFAAYYFAFNCLLEASSWLKDRSAEKDIKHIDPKIKEEFFQSISRRPESSDTSSATKSLKQTPPSGGEV
jgi:hypothetical protein